MSAARLRKAATLLRERATAATTATGNWSVSYIPEDAVPNAHIIDRWFIMDRFESGAGTGPYAMCEYEPTASFIATMSPPVALALADLLDDDADGLELFDDGDPNDLYRTTNAVADAILGGAK